MAQPTAATGWCWVVGKPKQTHWHHRCSGLRIGRTSQTAVRAVSKGQACELCGTKDPKAASDKAAAKLQGRLKAQGLVISTARVPRAYQKEFQAFAATLRHRYAESQTLCEGRFQHVISEGICLRCKEEL